MKLFQSMHTRHKAEAPMHRSWQTPAFGKGPHVEQFIYSNNVQLHVRTCMMGSSLQELDIEVPHNMHVHYSKGSPEVSTKQLFYAIQLSI